MRDSLRLKIFHSLKANGQMTVRQLEELCHREGRKVSNGERRLRELQDPTHASFNRRIDEVKNDKGAIIAYTYTPSEWEKLDLAVRTNQLEIKGNVIQNTLI